MPEDRKLTLIQPGDDTGPNVSPLGAHGQTLWDRITSEYAFDDSAGQEMLKQCCLSAERAARCREQIDRDGELVRATKAGGWKPHPLLRVELDCRAFVVRTLSRLGCTFEPVRDVGRPAGR